MYCILCILSSVDDIECAKLLMKWTGPTRSGYPITTPGTIQNTCVYYLPVYIIYPSLLFTCVYYLPLSGKYLCILLLPVYLSLLQVPT